MKLALVASVLLFFILPASAFIPAGNISDNKSYVAEPNTNTSFAPENTEIFIPEKALLLTPIPTSTLTSIPISSSTSSNGGSSSSGGGGGGGISSSENFSNIIQFEEHEGTLIAGQPVSFKFNLSIYEVILTGKENEDVSTRVELLKDLPQKVTVKPQGEVISYFNVVTSSKRLKEVIIRFISTQPSELFIWNHTEWQEVSIIDDPEILDKLSKHNDSYTYSIQEPQNTMSFVIVKSTSAIPTSASSLTGETASEITNTSTLTAVPKQSSGFGAGLVFVAFLIVVFRKHR